MQHTEDHLQRKPVMVNIDGLIRMEIAEWKIERLSREVEKRKVEGDLPCIVARVEALERLLYLQGQLIKELQQGGM